MSNDEQILKVLEEIRDTQKTNLEEYRAMAKRQEEAIALQKQAVGRLRSIFPFLLVVFIIALVMNLFR